MTMIALKRLAVLLVATCGLASAQEVKTTLDYRFTLTARNLTAKPPGVPLVLGQAGVTSGYQLHVSSTAASYPYNEYPELGLATKFLEAYDKKGNQNTNAIEVQPGVALTWVSTSLPNAPKAPIFSVVTSRPSDEYPALAAGGISNLWSLCTTTGNRPQTNVIYGVSEEHPPEAKYDPKSCYPVEVMIKPYEEESEETPETETPETPEVPKAQAGTDSPDTSDSPDSPDAPDTPDSPDSSNF